MAKEIKVIIVTQARVGSTRFPEKVLKPIMGNTLLGLHLDRLKKCKVADSILVATTFEDGAEKIIEIADEKGVNHFQGPTNDVLERFYQAVKNYEPEYVVRVTSDCPLIDPVLVDQVVEFTQLNKVDYVSNGFEDQYPDGQDIEVFKFSALKIAREEARLNSDREHVTPYIRNNSDRMGGTLFTAKNFPSENNFSAIRMTVDEKEDYNTIVTLVEELGTEKDWQSYTNFIIDNPHKFKNQKIIRNEGYQKSLKNDLK